MKCYKCNGRKQVLEPCDNGFGTVLVTCDVCDGTGEVIVTNDEWRKYCSAEEFAKFVEKAMDYGAFCQTKDDFNPKTCKKCGCPWCKNGFMNWLEEVYKE